MRILITGGAGFIGAHLVKRLLKYGHEVGVLDLKPAHEFPKFLQDGFGHSDDGLIQYPSFPCQYLPKIPSINQRWDFVYHLAATVGVRRVMENPKACIENNLDALRAVLALGLPGLYASTSEVYGKSDANMLAEDSPLVFTHKARWSYATSKLIGEYLVQQSPGWKTVRLFNVVGPGQNSSYGAVLPTFVRQALANEPITIHGTGNQVRTFIDVRDCVALLDELRYKEFEVVNVGGNTICNLNSLADDVAYMLDSRSNIVHVPHMMPPGFEECYRRIPDLTRQHELLREPVMTKFSNTVFDIAEAMKWDSLQMTK